MKLTDPVQLRVLHVITGLGTGGAEMMLTKLLEEMPPTVSSKVMVLMGRGALSEKIESLGTDIEYLGAGQGRLPNSGAVMRMLTISRQYAPDAIQGWMYHGNLAAWLINRSVCRRAKLFWNIRQTLYDLACEKRLTRWLIGLSRWLSSVPQKIIYNSSMSAVQHEAIGYPQHSRVVIPNGFDLKRFRPDASARESVCKEFGLVPMAPLAIHVARYHPMKDHRTLLASVKKVLAEIPAARFLLIGYGVTTRNQDLRSFCQEMGLQDTVILAGECFDLPRLMAAADVAVLSSAWGEGFPNVVGEAMACGTPCVVTDVGDSALVVDKCGRVVPPRNAEALAKAIVELLRDRDLREDLGNKTRKRIQDLYSIEQIGKAYLDLYQG